MHQKTRPKRIWASKAAFVFSPNYFFLIQGVFFLIQGGIFYSRGARTPPGLRLLGTFLLTFWHMFTAIVVERVLGTFEHIF